MATINGTANPDTLTGTAEADSIYGLAGNDTLSGLVGNDYLTGGDGNDSLIGGDGGDSLYGNAGADRLQGDGGDDGFYVYAGEGPDTIDGGAGNDFLYLYYYNAASGQNIALSSGNSSDGSSWQNIESFTFTGSDTGSDSATGGAGSDNFYGYGGNDTLIGLAGTDYLSGGAGNDSLSGGDDYDSLYGNAGADRLDGGAGDDYLYVNGGEGPDTIDGGAGNDYLYLNYSTQTVGQTVALASGNSTDGSLWQNIERFTFYGSDSAADSATGSAGQDAINGGGGNDTLGGLGGGDNLHGGGGDDEIRGGDDGDALYGDAGADLLDGGAGDDYFYIYGDQGPDTVLGGAGNDSLYIDYSTVGAQSLDFSAGSASDGTTWLGIEHFTVYGSQTGGDLVIGGGTALTLNGYGGADTLLGGSIADYIYGGPDNDQLGGGEGSDILDGDEGDDRLSGGDGADYLYGGAGTDQLAGDGGNDGFYSYRGEGADTLDGGPGSDWASFYNWVSTDFRFDTQGDGSILLTDINLSDGNDGVFTLRSVEWAYFNDRSIQLGTDNSGDEDYDLSGPGGGTVAGGDGNDTYIVDDPDDTPVEQADGGIDTVQASISWTLGANLDNLVLVGTADLSGTGNVLPNQITGNSGRNALDGGSGGDTLQGGAGGDTYYIDDPGDQVIETATSAAQRGAVAALLRAERLVDGIDERPLDAGEDADTIVASLGRAVLSAYVESGVLAEGSAAREMIGNVLANEVQGNSAGNLLQGGAGNDTLNGGDGIDVAAYLGNRVDYTITIGGATVTITDNNAADGNEGVDTLSGIEALRFADQVFEIGNLTVNDGTASGDAVDLGSAGMQAGAGGAGDDTYTVNAAGDAVIERPNQGTDTVHASINWTLWENIEQLVLTGGAVEGAGNAHDNALTGNDASNLLLGYAGNDTLNGGPGADTLRGGSGNDVYVYGSGDKLVEQLGEGIDTVKSTLSFTLATEFEKLVLTGGAAVNGKGNSANNALTGNTAANRLEGGEGNDTLNGAAGKDSLIGGAGNDTYVVGTGDKLTELPGGGTDTVKSTVSWTLAANIEKLTLTGSKAINGTGSSDSNTLTGNGGANLLKGAGGNDTLAGGGGNDVLIGGAGNDRLTGGAGADAFVFETALSAASNRDTITDFTTGNDKLRLDDDIFSAFDASQSTSLAAGAFRSGAGVVAAVDADDRILYNVTTGALYYDADGTGAAAAVQFAVLGSSAHPSLAAADFVIVG